MVTAAAHITTVLGIDYGARRIGIAVGQTITATASPLTTLSAIGGLPDWEALKALIEEWRPQALIVGMPYHIDGSENDMTREVRTFCNDLSERFTLPVYPHSETLSSYEAESRLKKNLKIGQHNKGEIDRMAAALITQSWLDQH